MKLLQHMSSYQSVQTWLISFTVLVSLLLTGTAALMISSDYIQTTASAERQLTAYSLAIKEQSQRTLHTASTILSSVAQHVEGAGGIAAFNERQLHDYLLSQSRNADIGALFILDAKGRLGANTVEYPVRPVDATHRDYYQHLSAAPSPDLYIGGLARGELLNGWRYFLARALLNQDNSFGGIAALTLDAEYFTRFYQVYNIGSDVTVTLCRLDGTIFAMSPFAAGQLTESKSENEALFNAALQDGRSSGLYRIGSLTSSSASIGAFQLLTGFPAAITVTRPAAAILEPFFHRALGILLAMLLALGLILFLCRLLLKKLQDMAKIKDELAASEEKYSKAFKHSADITGLIRLSDGHWIEISQSFTNTLGYQPDEIIEHGESEINLWEDPALLRRLIKELRKQNTCLGREVRWRAKNGQIRLGLLASERIEINGQLHGLLVWHDITERKRTEEALVESQELFATAFRCSSDVIMLVDTLDMRCLEVSDIFYEKFGYTPEEVIGKNSAEAGVWLAARERAEYLRQLLSSNQIRNVEAHWRTKAGEIRTGIISGDVLLINGRRCLLKSWHDITELKAAQYSLQTANEELEHKVNIRTAELTAANQELIAANEELGQLYHRLQEAQSTLIRSEKMAALARMVSGLAHEINTPLGICVTIGSHLGMLNQQLYDRYKNGTIRRQDLEDFVKENQETTQVLLANANRAAQLVMNFKQVSVDQISEAARQFNLLLYIKEIVSLLMIKLKKTGHEITIDCPDDLVIEGYPGALAQIITNLTDNSLTHGFAADVKGHIHIAAKRIDSNIQITYQDDGIGMTSDITAKIFDPFFTTRRSQGNTGLGMSIVYNLVTQLYRGSIEIISAPGQGTTFKIQLPLNLPPG